MKYKLDFLTSHCQFYICDKESTADTSSDDFWTHEAFLDRLAFIEDLIGIGTSAYGPIKGEIEILDSQPPDNGLDGYDSVAEVGIFIKSGILQVRDCPNNHVELEVPLQKSHYRVRVLGANLDIEDEDEGGDYYKIEIWESQEKGRKILKRYR